MGEHIKGGYFNVCAFDFRSNQESLVITFPFNHRQEKRKNLLENKE